MSDANPTSMNDAVSQVDWAMRAPERTADGMCEATPKSTGLLRRLVTMLAVFLNDGVDELLLLRQPGGWRGHVESQKRQECGGGDRPRLNRCWNDRGKGQEHDLVDGELMACS